MKFLSSIFLIVLPGQLMADYALKTSTGLYGNDGKINPKLIRQGPSSKLDCDFFDSLDSWQFIRSDVDSATFKGASYFPNGTASTPSVSFVDGRAMGVYRIGANILGFSTGGSEILRMQSNGTICLGDGSFPCDTSLTQPSIQLQRSGGSDATILFNHADSTWTAGARNGGNFYISSGVGLATSPQMVFATDGNIGVSSTSPSGKFVVQVGTVASLAVTPSGDVAIGANLARADFHVNHIDNFALVAGATKVITASDFVGILFIVVGGGSSFYSGSAIYGLNGAANTAIEMGDTLNFVATCGSGDQSVCYSATDDSYRVINNHPSEQIQVSYSLIGLIGDQ